MDDPSQPAPHPGSPPWHPKQQYRPPGLGEASPRAAPASKAEPGPLEVLRGWAIPAGLGGAQAPSSGHGASLAATTDPAESDDGRSSAYDAPPAPDVDAAQRAAAAEQALAQLHQQMEQQQALLQDASYRWGVSGCMHSSPAMPRGPRNQRHEPRHTSPTAPLPLPLAGPPPRSSARASWRRWRCS